MTGFAGVMMRKDQDDDEDGDDWLGGKDPERSSFEPSGSSHLSLDQENLKSSQARLGSSPSGSSDLRKAQMI